MTFGFNIKRSVLVLFAASLFGACGGDDSNSSGNSCGTEGQTQVCTCPGDGGPDLQGAQTCMAGMWGPCTCTQPAMCGNNIVEGTEQCDGTNLGGETCSSATVMARPSGTLRCNLCMLDVSSCTVAAPVGGTGGVGVGGSTGGLGGTAGVGVGGTTGGTTGRGMGGRGP